MPRDLWAEVAEEIGGGIAVEEPPRPKKRDLWDEVAREIEPPAPTITPPEGEFTERIPRPLTAADIRMWPLPVAQYGRGERELGEQFPTGPDIPHWALPIGLDPKIGGWEPPPEEKRERPLLTIPQREAMQEETQRIKQEYIGWFKDLPLPEPVKAVTIDMITGLTSSGMDMLTTVMRIAGQNDAASMGLAFTDAQNQAAEELSRDSITPRGRRMVRSALRSIPTMFIFGKVAGARGAILSAATIRGNQAIKEAEDAGLSAREASIYTAQAFAIEGGIAGMFQLAGMGGLESMVASRQLVRGTFKQFGIAVLHEVPEEVLTELTDNHNQAFTGVDPNALTPENISETVIQTIGTTLISLGMVQGVQSVSQLSPAQAAKPVTEAVPSFEAPVVKEEAPKPPAERKPAEIAAPKPKPAPVAKKLAPKEVKKVAPVAPEPLPAPPPAEIPPKPAVAEKAVKEAEKAPAKPTPMPEVKPELKAKPFAELNKRYDAIQKRIDDEMDRQIAKGLPFEEASETKAVEKLYAERFEIDVVLLDKYTDTVEQAFEEQGLPIVESDDDQWTPVAAIIKQVFATSSVAKGKKRFGVLEMAVTQSQRALNNRKETIEKLTRLLHLRKSRAARVDPDLVLGPQSALTDLGKREFLKESADRAVAIFDRVVELQKEQMPIEKLAQAKEIKLLPTPAEVVKPPPPAKPKAPKLTTEQRNRLENLLFRPRKEFKSEEAFEAANDLAGEATIGASEWLLAHPDTTDAMLKEKADAMVTEFKVQHNRRRRGEVFLSTEQIVSKYFPESKQKKARATKQYTLFYSGLPLPSLKKMREGITLPPESTLPDVGKPEPDPSIEITDKWWAEKDEWIQEANIDAAKLQDKVKETIKKKRFGKAARDVDMAIQLHIDLKNKPEQISKWSKDLNLEQKRLVTMSQNLTPEQQAIADVIIKMNERSGQLAKDADVIGNIHENYTARIWEIPEGEKRITGVAKFSTTTPRAKRRTLESILHGWAKGMNLRVPGATNAQVIARTQVAQTIADRNLLKTAMKAKIISTKQEESDWAEIRHPNFKTWDAIGAVEIDKTAKVEAGKRVQLEAGGIVGTVIDIKGENATVLFTDRKLNTERTEIIPLEELIRKVTKTYAADIFITDDGTVMQRRPLYAEPKFAKKLNRALGVSWLKGYSWIEAATVFNAHMKAQLLFTSLFHHQAFLRSYMFAGRGTNPIVGWKEGKKAIDNFSEELRELVRAGLTIGRIQDFDPLAIQEKTRIGKVIDKVPMAREIKNLLIAFRDAQADFLFKKLGPYLKVHAALLEYRHLLKKHRRKLEYGEVTQQELAKIAAEVANADFGGLHLGRMGRDPTTQHAMRLLLLAPDWTESNVRSMTRAFAKGIEGQAYRAMWARIGIKAMGATIIANLLLAGFDDDEFWRRYKKAWDEGKLRMLDVDITPLYRALGGKDEKTKYFSLIGHFRDPIKFVFQAKKNTNGIPDPMFSILRSAKGKSSILSRIVMDYVTGTDWMGRGYTTLPELAGFGKEKFKGKTVKWDFGGRQEIGLQEFPSFFLNHLRGTMPIQSQKMMEWYAGEIDGFDALTQSMGLMVHTTRGKKKKKRETKYDWEKRGKKKKYKFY